MVTTIGSGFGGNHEDIYMSLKMKIDLLVVTSGSSISSTKALSATIHRPIGHYIRMKL